MASGSKESGEPVFVHDRIRKVAARANAEVLADEVLRIHPEIQRFLDVGGGQGELCEAMRQSGVQRVLCVDGPHVDTRGLCVQLDEFLAVDLSQDLPPAGRFDLVACIEVAEHLPSTRAGCLVEYLCACSDVVLFSAAIPGQIGVNHINCRPPSYWKALFSEQHFVRHDILRPRLIGRVDVSWWLRQNLFLFVRDSANPKLELKPAVWRDFPDDIELVTRPVLHEYRKYLEPPGIRKGVALLLSALKRRWSRSRISGPKG